MWETTRECGRQLMGIALRFTMALQHLIRCSLGVALVTTGACCSCGFRPQISLHKRDLPWRNSFGHAPATTPLLWMRMPGGASTGLKCHIAATDKCRIGRLKQRVKAHCAGEIVRRSPTRWLGADTFDFHCSIPLCPPASAAYSFERRRQAAARPFLS
jgi:hypothetical protein